MQIVRSKVKLQVSKNYLNTEQQMLVAYIFSIEPKQGNIIYKQLFTGKNKKANKCIIFTMRYLTLIYLHTRPSTR